MADCNTWIVQLVMIKTKRFAKIMNYKKVKNKCQFVRLKLI